MAGILGSLKKLTMRGNNLSAAQMRREIEKLTNQMEETREPDTTKTQKQPLEGMGMNRAGGYSYVIDNETKLKRYIIIGSESTSYNAVSESKPCENIQCVMDLIKEGKGKTVLDTITKLALEARVCKEENILMVLRDCAMYSGEAQYDENTSIQRAAYDRVYKICNIPTKLFRFLELCEFRLKRDWKPPEHKKTSKRQMKRKNKLMEVKIETPKYNGNAENEDGVMQLPNTETPVSVIKKIPTENIEDVNDDDVEPKKKKPKKDKKDERKNKRKELKNKKKELKCAAYQIEKQNAEKKEQPPQFKKSFSWGRMKRRGISAFYTDQRKDANRLLLLLTKYKSRHNWSHKQVLNYAHPKIEKTDDRKEPKDIVLTYAVRGYDGWKKYLERKGILKDMNLIGSETSQVIKHIEVLNEVQKLSVDKPGDLEKLLNYLKEYGIRPSAEKFTTAFTFTGNMPEENTNKKKVSFQLVREHIPTNFFKTAQVWESLLVDMPMTALIRNLGKMTNLNLFEKEENIQHAVEKLTNARHLRAARIHPLTILIALKVYQQGHGDKGFKNAKPDQVPLTWKANPKISQALDKAFYLSFKSEEKKVNDDDEEEMQKDHPYKTGKNFMLALDVSGSMTWAGCLGCELITPAVASFALAMVTWNIEDDCHVMAFGGRLEDLRDRLRKDMTIDEATNVGRAMNFGRTDCALPMVYALEKKLDIDVFIVYTDSDTWFGKIHPSEALINYRRQMNKPEAKLIVMAMQSNGFTIADPKDKYMLDVCGFDSDVPNIIHEFAKGHMSSDVVMTEE